MQCLLLSLSCVSFQLVVSSGHDLFIRRVHDTKRGYSSYASGLLRTHFISCARGLVSGTQAHKPSFSSKQRGWGAGDTWSVSPPSLDTHAHYKSHAAYIIMCYYLPYNGVSTVLLSFPRSVGYVTAILSYLGFMCRRIKKTCLAWYWEHFVCTQRVCGGPRE